MESRCSGGLNLFTCNVCANANCGNNQYDKPQILIY